MIIILAKMNKMMMMVILMTSLFMKGTFWNLCMVMPLLHVINNALYDYYAESLTQNFCTHGDVRLVGTPLTSQGVVEICLNSHWGRVCRDGWDNNDAKVVCNQLGFG